MLTCIAFLIQENVVVQSIIWSAGPHVQLVFLLKFVHWVVSSTSGQRHRMNYMMNSKIVVIEYVSEWCKLFNNIRLHFETMMISTLYKTNMYSSQQCIGRYDTPLCHIILIPIQTISHKVVSSMLQREVKLAYLSGDRNWLYMLIKI